MLWMLWQTFLGNWSALRWSIHSFFPLACAECDDSLPFSGASSIPLCYIPFPSPLFCQLVFHPPSLHLAIFFMVYLSALFFRNSYIILFLGILFSSILCTFPNHYNLFNLIVSVIMGFLTVRWEYCVFLLLVLEQCLKYLQEQKLYRCMHLLSNLCFILEYVFVKCSVMQCSTCNWLFLPYKSCLKIIWALKSVLCLRFLCRWPWRLLSSGV